jgi:hypothetical protein
MLLLIKKSFPWYRDAYKQGDKREVDEKTARQFIAAGLAAPTKADPPKTKPAVVRQTAQAADVTAAAAEPKPAGETEKPATDAENEEDKDKSGARPKPGSTTPYKRRDMTPAK